MQEITIKLTNKCNFNCRYCIFKGTEYNTVEITKICGLLNKFKKGIKRILITGGEPLLETDRIYQLVKSAKNKDIQIDITTNGSLLDKEKIDFFKHSNVKLIISIDGNRKSNDLNRIDNHGKSTFEKMIEKIGLIKESGMPLNIAMTIDPSNVSHFFENFVYLLKYEPSEIDLTPVLNKIWKEGELRELDSQLRGVIEKYLEYTKERKLFLSITKLSDGSDETSLEKAVCLGKCQDHLFLDANGNLYLCGSYLNLPSKKVRGIIGNINDGIDSIERKIRAMEKPKIKPCLFQNKAQASNQKRILEIFIKNANKLQMESKENTYTNKRDIKKMFAYVTKRCNLDCDYCYLDKKKEDDSVYRELGLNEIKKGIRLLMESEGFNKYFRFMGGEPLLRFGLIKRAVRYIRDIEKDYGKKTYIEIATNGTILNNDMISFLKGERIGIHFSIDGPKHIHLKNRKCKNPEECYDKIVANLIKLREAGVNIKCNFVVSPKTVDNIIEVVNFLVSLGIKDISYEPAIGIRWDKGDIIKLNKKIKELIKYYQNKLLKNNIKIYSLEGLELIDYINKHKEHDKFYSFGCERNLTINSDGKIVNCPCYPDDDSLILGDLKKDSLEKLKSEPRINYLYFKNEEEKKEHRVFCKDYCLKDLRNKGDNPSQLLHELCVVSPVFHYYRYLINYKPLLFNLIAKEKLLDPSQMYLDIMPHFIDGADKYFIKNNRLIRSDELEVMDLNNLNFDGIEKIKQGNEVAFKGFIPPCKLKRMNKNEKKIIIDNLVPYSCVGCPFFFKISGDKVILCSGESLDLKKFSVHSALMGIKKQLKLTKECKNCECYTQEKCFGYCKYKG